MSLFGDASRDELERALDLQHRMLVNLARRNGGRLTFSHRTLFEDGDFPPLLTFMKDDLYRTVEVVVKGEEPS